MEKLMKAWLIITLITFIVFKLGETMTRPYSETPADGNLYGIVLLIAWPFLLVFIWVTIRLTRRAVTSVRPLVRLVLALGAIGMIGVSLFVNLEQAQALRDAIADSSNASYAVGWNQFTNIVYLNQLTFFCFTVACMLIGILASFKKTKSNRV